MTWFISKVLLFDWWKTGERMSRPMGEGHKLQENMHFSCTVWRDTTYRSKTNALNDHFHPL